MNLDEISKAIEANELTSPRIVFEKTLEACRAAEPTAGSDKPVYASVIKNAMRDNWDIRIDLYDSEEEAREAAKELLGFFEQIAVTHRVTDYRKSAPSAAQSDDRLEIAVRALEEIADFGHFEDPVNSKARTCLAQIAAKTKESK